MKITGYIAAAGAAAALSIGLAGCGATDVVAKVANTSFTAIAEASGSRVAWVEGEGAWALASPEGDELRLSAESPAAEFSFDAAPFVAAGLDPAKLPAAEGIGYEIEGGRFRYRFELGQDKFAADARKSLEATFAEIVRSQRPRIGYHEKLDHYGIKLGNGNMFEWAKDLSKNDKDIVWVLDPGPFLAAGVDPAAIKGWAFAKVETKDDSGKVVFVDKLLRPFDLR